MTRTATALLFCAAPLLTVACGEGEDPKTGTHIGNPVELSFVASSALTAAEGELVMEDDGGTPYTLSEARLNLRDIELDLPDSADCADIADALEGARCDSVSRKVIVDGPFVVDLLTATATPTLADVRLPALAWRRIDFRIDDAAGLNGDDLDGHSFVARADFERGGQMAELRVRLKFNEDARVEAPSGVVLPDGGRLTVDFDAGAWLRGLGIGACLDAGGLTLDGGVVLVDEDADCDDIEQTFKDNIKDNTTLRSGG